MQLDPAEHPIVQVARDLQPLIAECADETEANGKPPDHLIETFTDAGLFRLFIPADAGGLEVPPLVTFHTVEALSEADPSSGWVVMLAAELSLVTGFIETDHLRKMIGSDDPGGPRCRIAGSARPTNWGKRAEGGWIINGIATYASGIDHATLVVAAFRDEDQPGDSYMSFLDPDQGTILRTWDTMGLRGTGSHDYESSNVFAPDQRTMKIGSRPHARGPNWRIPDSGIASWLQNGGQALGAAQGAINEVVDQAKNVASKSDSARWPNASTSAWRWVAHRRGSVRPALTSVKWARWPGNRFSMASPTSMPSRSGGLPMSMPSTPQPRLWNCSSRLPVPTPFTAAGRSNADSGTSRSPDATTPGSISTGMPEPATCSECPP